MPPVVCEFFDSHLQIQAVLLQRTEKSLYLCKRWVIKLPVSLLASPSQFHVGLE
jgi:hypothetical protein